MRKKGPILRKNGPFCMFFPVFSSWDYFSNLNNSLNEYFCSILNWIIFWIESVIVLGPPSESFPPLFRQVGPNERYFIPNLDHVWECKVHAKRTCSPTQKMHWKYKLYGAALYSSYFGDLYCFILLCHLGLGPLDIRSTLKFILVWG